MQSTIRVTATQPTVPSEPEQAPDLPKPVPTPEDAPSPNAPIRHMPAPVPNRSPNGPWPAPAGSEDPST